MNNYYYANGQQQVGPYSLDELRAMNVITPTTKVWQQGMVDWAEAQTVAEFSGWFGYTPPPLVPPVAPSCMPPAAPSVEATAQPMPARPYAWLAPAIVATVLCCTPFGIVSIVYAAKVDSRYTAGDYAGAVEAARAAKTWFWWSFGVAAFLYLGWVLMMILGAVSSLVVRPF